MLREPSGIARPSPSDHHSTRVGGLVSGQSSPSPERLESSAPRSCSPGTSAGPDDAACYLYDHAGRSRRRNQHHHPRDDIVCRVIAAVKIAARRVLMLSVHVTRHLRTLPSTSRSQSNPVKPRPYRRERSGQVHGTEPDSGILTPRVERSFSETGHSTRMKSGSISPPRTEISATSSSPTPLPAHDRL